MYKLMHEQIEKQYICHINYSTELLKNKNEQQSESANKSNQE